MKATLLLVLTLVTVVNILAMPLSSVEKSGKVQWCAVCGVYYCDGSDDNSCKITPPK